MASSRVPAYRLDVEYDGTRYHGWQEQRNARSVAGELRQAITTAGGSLIELGGSGRTDAGVHALAQTAHLRLRAPVDPGTFRRGVNDALPPDIHVLSLLPACLLPAVIKLFESPNHQQNNNQRDAEAHY